jgi:site-specific recombinase XerD
VPLPQWLLADLDGHFDLHGRQGDTRLREKPLWSFSRCTAWRLVKRVMSEAGVLGARACPRGLRHGFGVGALQSGIPVTLLQRWLGHARLTTTAIYVQASGPEEREIAKIFWEKG